MQKTFKFGRSPKISIPVIAIVLLLIFSAVFVIMGRRDSNQSSAPTIAGVDFFGEYRIGDGEWRPIVQGEHISSTRGSVTLRGYFRLLDPMSGEPICPVPEGSPVSLYLNHISCTVVTPTGDKILFDCESSYLGEDACAIITGSYDVVAAPLDSPENESDIYAVTLILTNPHDFGNENAIDEFLTNMSLAPGVLHESMMLDEGALDRSIGLVILVSSLIILGISVFSTVIHIKNTRELWLIGLMSLAAGGYFMFDAFGVGVWNSSYNTNTRMLGISMMFYMLFSTCLMVSVLEGKLRKLAAGAVSVSGIAVALCMLVSMSPEIKFYDTWIYWVAVELAVALVLALTLVVSFIKASFSKKILCTTGILALLAFGVDASATYTGLWEGGFISKHVFLVIFFMALVVVLRIIPSHVNAAIKAKQLEAEQQALKLELQESRISIMLSQMQPHFIFNTLNTIYHLCEIDPETARNTISSFSEYLRNNIDNLGHSDMISFEKELSFVKTYLNIEKVRFDDELEILYDIQTTSFKLPVLSVQPIVENAVKHGTSKKEGTSTLTITTRETGTAFEIIIADTGVGFDTAKSKDDGHEHIGISSVRQRLDNLCGGTLSYTSAVGVGTTATITIPKTEAKK